MLESNVQARQHLLCSGHDHAQVNNHNPKMKGLSGAAVVCSLITLSVCGAKKVSRHLSTHQDWIFLDKFCFDDTGISGKIAIDLQSNRRLPEHFVVGLYDDQRISWEEVYHSDLTCHQRLKHARTTVTPNAPMALHRSITVDEKVRPRWWYVVAATCGPNSDDGRDRPLLEIDYSLHFTNVGGLWQAEFSWDEQGLLQCYAACCVLCLVWLALYLADLRVAIRNARRLHSAPFVVVGVLVAVSSSFSLSLLHYTVYASDGVGLEWARVLGVVSHVGFQLGSIVFGVAMAKGWTLSNEALRTDPKFALLVGSLIAIEGLAYFWHYNIQDPARSIYIFNSPPRAGGSAPPALCARMVPNGTQGHSNLLHAWISWTKILSATRCSNLHVAHQLLCLRLDSACSFAVGQEEDCDMLDCSDRQHSCRDDLVVFVADMD